LKARVLRAWENPDMPTVFPFRALQYRSGKNDVSQFVAPPYDVLDADAKSALLAKDPHNVAAIDLPHVPAKELGPPEAYQGAADALRSWIESGVISKRDTPAMFAYRQKFDFLGKSFERCGIAAAVETVPFGPREGGGVLAHEQTFSGPKEDRLALMRATATQMSPIFGLHPDEQGRASKLVRGVMDSRDPDMTADLGDGVTHEIWTIEDEQTISAYQESLAGEDIFIADGHHRYTTGLNYLDSLGDAPAEHPARRCMMVLIGMSDPGLAIGPTHRVLGGMDGYNIDAFQEASAGILEIKPCDNDPAKIEDEMAKEAAGTGRNVFGIIDFATGLCFTATPAQDDPLSVRFADKPEAWRKLDVAIIQHVIVEEICEPKLNSDQPVKWAFPHTVDEVMAIGRGDETGAGGGAGFAQLGVIVRPTPLGAVKDISNANELMPQKSTYFYPKLATGLFVNPLS